MKREMKQISRVVGVLLLAAVTIFTSCNDEETILDAKADAYVIKKRVNDEVKYAISFYAYANKELSSVTVSNSEGEENSLTAASNAASNFYSEPTDEDYSVELPAEENFTFDILAKSGETTVIDEFLEFDDMDLPTIIGATYVEGSESLDVEWAEVSGADGFVIRILNDENEVVFGSPGLTNETSEYSISQAAGNWYGNVQTGVTYKIQIQSFAYESDAAEINIAYSVKEIAFAEQEIIWGE